MRQIGKQILTLTNRYTVLLCLFLGLAFALPASAQTKGTVTNFLTGVAISGYDPVSYFTEPEPLLGSSLYEYEWNGVPWYFATEANRDIFMLAPEVYAPLFGGHCAMSMARGFLSDGNPSIYRIVEDRLVLFYSVGNREAFDLARASMFPQAVSFWQSLPDNPARPHR
jgi:YHS domain-containing protein